MKRKKYSLPDTATDNNKKSAPSTDRMKLLREDFFKLDNVNLLRAANYLEADELVALCMVKKEFSDTINRINNKITAEQPQNNRNTLADYPTLLLLYEAKIERNSKIAAAKRKAPGAPARQKRADQTARAEQEAFGIPFTTTAKNEIKRVLRMPNDSNKNSNSDSDSDSDSDSEPNLSGYNSTT